MAEAERRVWLAPLGAAGPGRARAPSSTPSSPVAVDRGVAQAVLAAALAQAGLVPVGEAPAEVALWLAPARGGEGQAIRPRVGLVPELEPSPAWRGAAERYAVVDDGAAAALIARGVPVDRIVVTGWPLGVPWLEAAAAPVDDLRRRFGLGAGCVAVVDTRGLDEQALGALLVQVALLEDVELLFDAPDEAAAAVLRERCPPLGLRARRFAATADEPLLLRAADVLVGRPRPALVASARLLGAALLALPTLSEDPEAAAVTARGIGRHAPSVSSVAAAFEQLRGGDALASARAAALASARPAAAAALAQLVADVLRRRDAILAEPDPAQARAPSSDPPGAPGDPLAGALEEVGVPPDEHARLAADRRFARQAAVEEEARRSQDIDERLAALKARVRGPDPEPAAAPGGPPGEPPGDRVDPPGGDDPASDGSAG